VSYLILTDMANLQFANGRLLSNPGDDGVRFQFDVVEEDQPRGTFRIEVSGTYAGRISSDEALAAIQRPGVDGLLMQLYEIARNGHTTGKEVILMRDGRWLDTSDPAEEPIRALLYGSE
jgi:hypothetical protein